MPMPTITVPVPRPLPHASLGKVSDIHYLEGEKAEMRDEAQADMLLAQGRRAETSSDLEGLKAAVRQLIGLLPHEQQEKARGYGGTTIRFDM